MPLGNIVSVSKTKPKKMVGDSFEYRFNKRNKTYVKFEKVKKMKK